jgi:hypothetical protein
MTSIPETIKKTILIARTITLAMLLIAVIYYFIAQPQLPIFYSLARKNDQLANKEFIFLFPAISFVMNLLHFPVIKTLKRYSSLMLNLFTVTTTILQAVFLLSLLRIVMITI